MELDPVQLNRDIGQLETEAARLRIECAALAKSTSRSAKRRRYLLLANAIREPAASLHLWPFAVLLIGPVILGVALTIVMGLFGAPTSIVLTSFFAGALAGVAFLALLLYRPSDSVLAEALPLAESQWQFERGRLEEITRQMAEVGQQLKKLHADRRQLSGSDKLQRAMLLQRNWKAMRGDEWEDYLVEVCRTLGAHVERVANPTFVAPGSAKPVAGGRKAILSPANHLIVTISPRRFAVAPVAGINPFHPAAAQQTLNELAAHQCDATAIITNVRLTAGTRELAAHRRSNLIGEDEFPDFVLGKLNL